MASPDLGDVLELSKWLGRQGLTDEEHAAIMAFARDRRPPGITSYADHLRAICMAVEHGGQKVLRELVALALEPKEWQELRIALVSWGVERMKEARRLAATRALHEDDLFRLREDIASHVRSLWPHAHDAKIAGAVGLSTSLLGGNITIDWNRLFLAMQEPDSLKRPGDD